MRDLEILHGGNSNRVVKDGNSVIRNTGSWSPFVHHLLRKLTEAGFTASPVLLESTENQERLSFIEGEVGNDPLKPYMQTDTILVEAAQLLRRFHDITQHIVVPTGLTFQQPIEITSVAEVICHNDFAPYNCVFRDEHLVGMIDFDSASPGTRLWDIAYAVYRFVPLSNDDHSSQLGWNPIPDRARRLKLFCDTYALEDRQPLVRTVIQRLEALIDYMRRHSSNLEHIPLYVNDIAYLQENHDRLTAAIVGDSGSISS